MDNNLVPKSSEKFRCNCCDYTSSRLSQYERHLQTSKHKKITLNKLDNNPDNQKSSTQLFLCKCGKSYKYISGLSKHKKTCINLEEIQKENKNITIIKENSCDGDLLSFLLKENQEFKQMIIEQNNKLIELSQKTSTTINGNNNNCNNRFNINMFLNEKCKDAMNIMDFVDSLKLTLQDLEKTAEIGYVKGISNIIVNGLNQLDVYKRPIHCSDIKRETLYVKDNDAWEKENEDKKKITRAIKHISIRNAKQVGEWTKENKGYDDSMNKKSDKYLKIISEANGGEPEEINKIISNISTKVTIDKENV
jgi:hypothetical protein